MESVASFVVLVMTGRRPLWRLLDNIVGLLNANAPVRAISTMRVWGSNHVIIYERTHIHN